MNIKIERLDNFGRGIGYIDNKIVFVNSALEGEVVNIKIIKETSKYIEADILSIKNESNKRIKPLCPYYLKCGGCNLMHMKYQDEIDFKKNMVEYLINKKFNIKIDKIIINELELKYRNKINLKVNNYEYGYYKSETHEFLKIDDCLIANDYINNFLKKRFIRFANGEITIRSNYKGELLIIIDTLDQIFIDDIPDDINVCGIIKNNVLYGTDHFVDKIKDMEFIVQYDSFFQVNPYVAGEIFNILNENLSGDNLLDLYCGVGTLGLSLANKFKNVYGIEVVKNACLNAKENAKLNNIKNAHFISGDASIFKEKFLNYFDTIIIDPPRSGLNKKTLNNIIDAKPNNIAYVSCNVHTLLRDLEVLCESYKIEKFYVCDMFCKTYHTECVCILKKDWSR